MAVATSEKFMKFMYIMQFNLISPNLTRNSDFLDKTQFWGRAGAFLHCHTSGRFDTKSFFIFICFSSLISSSVIPFVVIVNIGIVSGAGYPDFFNDVI